MLPKPLVLCFNVSLATYLQRCLADCPSVTVGHFDGWAKANGSTRKQDESNEELGQRLLQRLAEGYGDARTYDAVLVDEAQDFAPSWFRCVLEAMKEPNDGDLVIVGDGSQGLYNGNRAISWDKLGIKARGRTIHKDFDLDKNYRNTRETLELAAAFAAPPTTEEADGVLSVAVNPEKALRSTGQKPVLIKAGDRADECMQILRAVDELLTGKHGLKGFNGPIQGSEIGILYPRLMRSERRIFNDFLANLRKHGPVVWLNQDKDARKRIGEPGIKVQTIHAAKGLQYRVVILMWADLLPSNFPDSDEEAERRLMYVAMTRPEDLLVITCSNDSAFIHDVRNTGSKVEFR